MPKEKFTLVRIENEVLDLLKGLAAADMRTPPTEIRWLVENEIALRTSTNVVAIQDLPAPEGAQKIPLVIVNEQA